MYGPMHFAVIGFERDDIAGGLLDQFDLVRELGIIRLIDFLFIEKDKFGGIEAMEVSDLTHEEQVEFGAVVGGLIGLGAAGAEGARAGAVAGAVIAENDFGATADDIREMVEDLPNSSSALVVLFEHTWALGLKNYILNNDGYMLAQGLLHPSALIEVGEELRMAVEAEAALELEEAEEESRAAKRDSNLARGTKSKGTSTKELKKTSSTRARRRRKSTK